MRNFNNQQVFKALLLAGGAGTLAFAMPAMAQDTPDQDAEVGADILDDEQDSRIVVTGSRIAGDFSSNSPMVTVDEALLEQSSTSAIEQNLNRLPQFVPAQTPTAGGDIQPTATNTPGAATVSLRGVGANRNLVLLDGRRGTPGNASGVVDISTIPAAAIERVEIISGGASATYGADAVAGVTNFILKKDFEGLELDAQLGITQEGDNFEYQLSGIMGSDFADGRGNVSLAMSINTREANFQRDRDWYTDLWQDPTITGTQFFLDTPGVNFGGTNLPNYATVFGAGAAGSRPGQTVFFQPDGTAFTSNFGGFGNNRFNLPDDGLPYLRASNGTISQNNTDFYLILPLTRYNVFARGNYEINDTIGVFAQGLFSHVETFTRNEPGPITGGWGVIVDRFRDTNNDGIRETRVIADSELPSELVTLLNSRPDPTAPFQIQALLPDNRETTTDVTTYNLTAGLEGSIPSTTFNWEAFVSHGISSTYAVQTGIYSLNRLRAVLNGGNFGRGFSATGNAAFGGFGAARATCTSGLNLFKPPTEGFSEDCLEATRADLKNRSEVTQTIAEANVTGSLFDLPAGELGIAVGASFREVQFQFDNDTLTTQGRSFQDQALGIYPSGNVDASFDVHELYGEMLIPILSDTFVNQLNLELGGRVSDYSTTGTSYTYKILGDLEVTDWLRFRGGYNRAERAPNIGELFLSAQQTFAVNTAGDPCAINNPLSFSANPANANAANVQAICRVLQGQADRPGFAGESAAFFYQRDPVTGAFVRGANNPSTFGFAFPTTVGNPNLQPEKADTWTAGVVVTSPFDTEMLRRFRLSVDWFDISVEDAIGEQTVAAALQSCFDPFLNPLAGSDPVAAANTVACQLVPRNAQTGDLGNVQRTYTNAGEFHLSGVDVQLDWGFDLGPGSVSLNFLANYLIDFESTALAGIIPLVDYTGTLGTGENGLNTGVYEYRILGTVGYNVGPLYAAIQWQHLPSVEDATEAQFGAPTPTTGYPSYNKFNLNGSYAVTDDFNIRFGVDNLFNERPPLGNVNTSLDGTGPTLPGGSYDGRFYDTNGRRFYLGANARF
ncbi:TonB-dependent receptor [Erythrobacter arachoides]|uniref:TonB-dependent receptor n=1 Tax=Aurantiacibacter arachoides TaxID=1850444 RepID=A0A845A072_9SPHN|nr:TonB-dependent receptor [Aurantiacibacter arachoides]MXO93114.1 TonB-dependent receptor [Aurantiacibacter arachoides]GGD51919.1 TonB-dependent receptor [Aurantiacibacter arachoides]